MANYRNAQTVFDNRPFQTRLQQLMHSRDFNQIETAEAVGISATSICRFFQDRCPDVPALIKIADYFNVSIDWLIGRKHFEDGSLTENDYSLISKYKMLDPSDKLIIDSILQKYDE